VGYTKAVDMWSLGVMTASLLTGGLITPLEELSQLGQSELVGLKFSNRVSDY
jgi:serine/threonine protein kinase